MHPVLPVVLLSERAHYGPLSRSEVACSSSHVLNNPVVYRYISGSYVVYLLLLHVTSDTHLREGKVAEAKVVVRSKE